MSSPSQARRAACALALAGCLLAGCGSSTRSGSGAPTRTVPAYVTAPFSVQQQRIAAGARLIVSDGCSVCHLQGAGTRAAPSFESFAGHRVTLADGRSALVDEPFLRASLLDPSAYALKGYAAGAMLRALAHLGLAHQPQQVADLAAFIEEIGPEA
jgi:cytochrome c5